MSRWLLVAVSSLLFASPAWAVDDQPRYKAIPSLGWSLDRVVDPTSIGTVTGTNVAFTDLDCSANFLSTDVNGNLLCREAGGTSHDILSVTHTDSVASAVSRGSLIYGNSTPAWAELNIGAVNSVIRSDGTDAAWTTTPQVVSLTATNTVTGSIAVDAPNLANSGSVNSGVVRVNDSLLSAGTVTGQVVEIPTRQVKVAGVQYNFPTADGSSGQVLSTAGNGVLSWASAAGSGDITSVGDVASGAAFDGSAGTTLTFEGDAGADFTLSYNTTTDDFHMTDDLNLYQSSPSWVLRDTTDDVAYSVHVDTAALHPFELFRGTDSGTGFNQTVRLLSYDNNNTLHLPQLPACDTLDTDGAGKVACGSDAGDVKEYWWPCGAMLPLEAADSIPPLTKDAGTALDQLACGFDADVDEGRTVVFKVPSDVNTAQRVTFRVYSYSAAATTGNFVLDFRHNGGVADGTDPDQTLTTEANSPDATAGTAGQLNVTSWTESVSTMAWAANDLVYGVLYRDANNSGDTLSGDLLIIGFSVEIPRS